MTEPLQQMCLEGVPLKLSLWQRSQAEALYALIHANRSHLRPWLGWIAELSDVASCDDYIRQLQQAFIARRALPCALSYGGELVGFCGLDRINRFQNKGRIGYWLASPYQGRGVMTAACRLLLRHSFHELGLDLLECLVAEHNQPSRALCERLGLSLQSIPQGEDLRCYHIKRGEYLE